MLPEPIITNDNFRQTGCDCPHCGHKYVNVKNTTCTLIGFLGNKDPNHFWHECVCERCQFHFTWEHKYNFGTTYSWYVVNGIVIKGRAMCCDSNRKYNCECGGIIHTYTEQYGKKTNVITFSYDMPKEERAKLIAECDKCGMREEIKK